METDKKKAGAPANKKRGFEAPKAVAVILSILLALFTITGLICFNVWRVLYNSSLVKETLTEEVVSSDLVPATLEIFSEWRAEQRVQNKESLSGVNEPDIVLLLSFMKADEWREIKNLLITEEFVVDVVSVSVDSLYAWIDSDDTWPDINWNMKGLKQRLTGQEGVDSIMVAYLTLPDATEEQIADFQSRLSKVPPGVEVLYNLAQFPEPWREDQVADYIDALESVNDNIPDNFNFSQEMGGFASDQEPNLLMVKNLLRLIRIIALPGWIVPLAILALILIFKVRSLSSLGKYVGIPLFIGGAAALAISLAGQPIVIKVISGVLLSAVSDFARLELTNSLTHLSSLFFRPLLIQGAVFAGAGLIMIILIFIKKKAKAPAAEENVPAA